MIARRCVLIVAMPLVLAACGDNLRPELEPDASITPVVCGNGELQEGEDCDDGNTILDTICDERCRFTCGNGTVDDTQGELCDPAATGAGACPATCDDGMACTADVRSGSDCQVQCMTSPITAPSNGDGCCPPGANSLTDDDCSVTCGNGVLETGEVCDTAIVAGNGACPSTCNDGQSCTTDALSMGGTCQATCTATPITAPTNGDGCCPPGATTANDNDCQPGCGNGVVDAGETCDTAIAAGAGQCPTTCVDNVACTSDVVLDAGTCTAACSNPPVTACANGDGCCPATCNANNDDTCTPRCGNAVTEAGEQCDDGNMNNADQCTNMCRIPIIAFKFTDLDLRDPHVFVDFIGCRDVTDNQLVGFSVNNELQTNIQTDGDMDGRLDLAPTLVFRDFSQTAATQPVQLYFASCSAPQGSTSCRPGTQAPIVATATNMTAAQCLTFLPGTVRPYVPAITSSGMPCFVTNSLTVNLDLGGIPITLRDARIAGTYVGNPASTMANGLLMGFISEADANTTIIPATFPLVGGKPLSELLAGGDPPGAGRNCASHSDKDTNNGVMGWWFYLNFPASRVPWSDM